MDTIGAINVAVGAKIDEFEAGMAKVQADLNQTAAAAMAASGRYVDANGRMREANGRFVSASTLAAEAAANVGGSLGKLSDQAQRTATTINGSLVASFAAYDRAIKPLEAGVGRLGQGMKDVGGSLTTSVTLPLTLAGGAALAAYGKIDSLSRGLNALATQDVAKQGATGIAAIAEAANATKSRLAELQEIAKAPGIGFEQAVQGDIRLRAVGISADQSAKVLREFANAIALTGGGSAELNSVTVQLGQLSAKGKVLAQDLRPIIEAAPAVSQALQKLYGTVDSETISASLAKQGKSSQEFVAILTDELAQLPRVAGGFNNALENFTQGGVQNLARLGESINKAFNLEGLLERVGGAITKLTDYFTSLSPATQQFILGGAAVAAAAGPIVFGLGAITAAIPSVVAGLEVMGLASTAALGPLGIGVAAVAAAAALVISHWDELVAYFDGSGEGGRLFSDLGRSVKESVEAISGAFGQLKGLGGGTFGDLISTGGVVKSLFRDIAVGVTAVSDVIGGTIGSVSALFRGDFTKSVEEAQRALYGLVDPLANVLGFTKAGPQVSFDEFFKLGDALKAADTAALADAASNNVNTASLAAADEVAKKHVVTLKELQGQLRAALEVRFNDAQAGRDTTADDAEIARIRALIAEFKQVPTHADAATKAMLEVQKSFRTIGNESLALGDQFNYLQARQAADQAGIKRLIDAGYSPFSSAVQKLTGDLRNLNVTLGDNEQLALRAAAGVKDLFKTPDFKLNVPKLDGLPDQLDMVSSIVVENPVLPDYTSIFGKAASDVANGTASVLDQFSNFSQAQADFNTNIEALLDAFPAEAFGSIGQSIGTALGDGTSVLEAAGKGFLQSLAQLGARYGQYLLLLGAADIATGFAVAKGIGELIAGTALIAGSGALGAFASSSSAGSTGGATTPATTPASGSTYKPTEAPVPAGYSSTTNVHKIEVEMSGRSLRGVLQIEIDRLGRVVGAG